MPVGAASTSNRVNAHPARSASQRPVLLGGRGTVGAAGSVRCVLSPPAGRRGASWGCAIVPVGLRDTSSAEGALGHLVEGEQRVAAVIGVRPSRRPPCRTPARRMRSSRSRCSVRCDRSPPHLGAQARNRRATVGVSITVARSGESKDRCAIGGTADLQLQPHQVERGAPQPGPGHLRLRVPPAQYRGAAGMAARGSVLGARTGTAGRSGRAPCRPVRARAVAMSSSNGVA